MNTKNKILIFLLLAVMLAIQVAPVAAQGETPPSVEITTSDEPSNEGENWPIIIKETHKRKDPSTGQEIVETIVVRQEPPTKDKTACKEKHQNKTDQAIVQAATCIVNRYNVVVQNQVSVGGGSVTGYVKGLADEYCSSVGGCGFYKIKRVDVWWKRSSTSFGVINARINIGCTSVCTLCTGGTTSYIWRSGYFNPGWSGGGLSSVVYTNYFSTMPIMRAQGGQFGGFPVAGTDSTATAPRSQTPLSVYVTFISP